MNPILLPLGSRLALRILMTGAAASLLAGCADSERFTNPFSNPFQQTNQAIDPAPTGSLYPAASAAPVGAVASRPLPSPVQTRPVATSAPIAPIHTAMAQSASKPIGAGPAGWSIAGGSPVTVAQGENAHTLSDRYGVPMDALVDTNGFTSAAQIQPGTHLVIPVYNAALAASSGARVAVEPSRPEPLRAERARAEPVKAEPSAKDKNLQMAKAKELVREPVKPAKKGPGASPANLAEPKPFVIHTAKAQLGKSAPNASPKPGEPKKLAAKSTPVLEKPLAAEKVPAKFKEARVQEAKPQEAPKPQTLKSEPAPQANTAPEAEKPSDSANPEFRWPARGRIIQGFKSGGNDGINIAVPEGTAVKAAEGGVVAYAGNELKGYGNLVLIRHPNGYVTAYANNADLEVKRGETVKRGQVIAKSGQTGNVASPQLHFELRKGATPVDPTQFLAGL